MRPVEPPPSRWDLPIPAHDDGEVIAAGGDLEPGTVLDAYRRGHMAHHREEFGPDEPDIPLYRGYPISRDSMRRKLVRDARGGVYGATYKWREDNSEADLVSSPATDVIGITTATGVRTQTWYYPSREDCLVCHTATAGGVLGVNSRQMNRDITYPSGISDNQIRAWNHVGLFDPEQFYFHTFRRDRRGIDDDERPLGTA